MPYDPDAHLFNTTYLDFCAMNNLDPYDAVSQDHYRDDIDMRRAAGYPVD